MDEGLEGWTGEAEESGEADETEEAEKHMLMHLGKEQYFICDSS